MDKKQDFLYKNNKYVDSSRVELDPSYIRKKRINRLINVIIFFVIIAIGLFLFMSIKNATINIEGKTYKIEDNLNDIDRGDKILFTYKDKADKMDFIKLRLNKIFGFDGDLAEVQVLSQGINPDDGSQIDQNVIYIRCLSQGCKGESNIISTKKVLGIAKEVK